MEFFIQVSGEGRAERTGMENLSIFECFVRRPAVGVMSVVEMIGSFSCQNFRKLDTFAVAE